MGEGAGGGPERALANPAAAPLPLRPGIPRTPPPPGGRAISPGAGWGAPLDPQQPGLGGRGVARAGREGLMRDRLKDRLSETRAETGSSYRAEPALRALFRLCRPPSRPRGDLVTSPSARDPAPPRPPSVPRRDVAARESSRCDSISPGAREAKPPRFRLRTPFLPPGTHVCSRAEDGAPTLYAPSTTFR